MFDDFKELGVLRTKTQTRRRRTVIVSAALQVGVLGVLILTPLLYPEALQPKHLLMTMLVAPPPPPPPPPPAMAAIKSAIRPLPRIVSAGKMIAPTAIPKAVAMIKEEPLQPDVIPAGVPGGVPGGIPGGQMGGVIGGIIGGAASTALPPPAKEGPKRIQLGGQLEEAKLVHFVQPDYPSLARYARLTGIVMLHAVIGEDGTVRELQAVSGPPLLAHAAIEAVKQWRYQPTLLNGEPYEVDTVISVVFRL
jgi:periplasmic protein TonB